MVWAARDFPLGQGIKVIIDTLERDRRKLTTEGVCMRLDELMREAEDGDAEAQYRLGVTLITGAAGELSWDAAQRWLIRAAANGYPGAHELASKLTRWVELEDKLQSMQREPALVHLQGALVVAWNALLRRVRRHFSMQRVSLFGAGKGIRHPRAGINFGGEGPELRRVRPSPEHISLGERT
jgi:hypothetical protein